MAEAIANGYPARRLSVAPMMERTDRHFRFLMRLVAPNAWLYTEMVTTSALLHGDPERHLAFDASEHPVALQLGGSDARDLARAARLGASFGYDEINLNVGCPSSRVQQARFGAALMLDAARVAECVAAMRDAVDIPVTVKTRLGVDEHDGYEFLQSFVCAVRSAGCRTLIVHARKAWLQGLSPKENREIPPLDYARVRRLKADFPDLEVIVNGGLSDRAGALAELEHVDGIMLGRGAYKTPLLVGVLDREIFDHAWMPDVAEVLRSYCGHVESELARGTPIRLMSRHLMGIHAGRSGVRRWRRMLSHLPEGADGLEALRHAIETSCMQSQPTRAGDYAASFGCAV